MPMYDYLIRQFQSGSLQGVLPPFLQTIAASNLAKSSRC